MGPGDVVADRFEVDHLAGTGGMGAVYRARDRLTGEAVALKVLLRAHNPERLMREGRVLAELSHPGIVRYVAHGSTPAGEHYIVMEWLEGEDLAQRLAREPLSIAESVALARRVAETLAAAHARGVVHRDVKPSNLFLPGNDLARVKVLDFGVARLLGATRAGTATGALLGTPGYMAPEQALGEKRVDARADVFSLACVLFECVTGRHAFQAEHMMGILAKIVLEDAPRARELREGVPQALDDVIAGMLAKDPARRPADGAAVVARLDEIASITLDTTHAAPANGAAASITEREQRLISVVLAGATSDAEEVAHALTVDVGSEARTLDVLRRAVAPFGARFEWLADGSLIGTISSQGTATDQAAQAARCALAIREEMPNVPIVLATGRSIVAGRLPVGEVIDRSTRLLRDLTAYTRAPSSSPTPALRAKSEVRIDEVTAGLLDTRFEIGGDETGLVLIGEREAVHGTRNLLGKATPCVGRDRELKTLEAIFDECVSEPVARAAVVTAPAGVGKSRLRYEFVRRLRASSTELETLVGRGDPMSAGSPFAMLAQALRRASGLREGEPLAVRQQKLRARVARHVAPEHQARVTEFIGELVGVPFPESMQLRAARQEPVLMGDQMRRAWEDFLGAECSAQPVLLVLEDLHWGDLPTVRFVDAALRTLADKPLMVLALARPEVHELFPRLWSERRMQEIRVEELTKRASERLIREVLGAGTDDETVARLVVRAAGNAFYLEELIRAVAEGKGDALPVTVIAMAQARLDALDPEARRILRAASIFGDTFWRGGALALLGAHGHTQAKDWLAELVAREVITERSEAKFDGEVEFTFRHALVREAAYASLTDSDRKLGHKLAAEWLSRVDHRDAMEMAEHFERGGEPEAALHYYLQGASDALKGNDFRASLARAARGIACGADGETRGRLLLLRAEAHRWLGEFADAERDGAEALELLTPRTPTWYQAVGELASASGLVGNHARLARLTASLQEAIAAGDVSGPLVIASARATVQLLHSGQYPLAGELLDRVGDATTKRAIDDPAVLGWLGRARMLQATNSGATDASRRHAAETTAYFEAAGDLRTGCLQRMNLGYCLDELGLYADAETTLRAALADAERIGLKHVVAPGKTFLGYALGGIGKIEEATIAEREAAALFAAQGDKRMEAASRNHLARMLIAAGDHEGAVFQARSAVALGEKIPGMRATSCGVLSFALLESGANADALAAAKEGMAILATLGRVDQGEARLRLAHACALEKTGDRDAARAAIAEARERILTRAAGMQDAQAKESFLTNVPENARTLALAAEWTPPS